MSVYLPLFPLNIVVYPGEKLNLHIFEPRYKQLVLDCVMSDKTFGIPTYIQNAVGHYGTEVEILSIEKKYDNGEMDIRSKGLRTFKILKFDKTVPGRLYAGGEIEPVVYDTTEDIVTKTKIKELMKQLYEALSLKSLAMDLDDSFSSFTIAHQLGLNLQQEYALLQMKRESDRQEAILQHLQNILPIVLETERLKERVKLNGHFKSLTPPNF
ncbi:LON peptidase substrate-binding domain-containing protein [Pontibacter sp. KCTC 32443]|uniref:LON peptidase substrate-binding domain-containing protein n=1 Tax=Pontibacter TaxID=323449 RepID=UPI00164D00C4|nr:MULTISPECIES: LON peptidase substrate-binding domain-containing protein [Pontibacter]MBC5773271.1 LON peptidase substrate-binding domain-containing protein [Pontibacter sp. KCTC 32443]